MFRHPSTTLCSYIIFSFFVNSQTRTNTNVGRLCDGFEAQDNKKSQMLAISASRWSGLGGSSMEIHMDNDKRMKPVQYFNIKTRMRHDYFTVL
jgi:hypothetical protein